MIKTETYTKPNDTVKQEIKIKDTDEKVVNKGENLKETITDEYLEKMKIAFETTKTFSLLGVLDNNIARNYCRKWTIGRGNLQKFVFTSAVGGIFGWLFCGFLGGIFGSWVSAGNPHAAFRSWQYIGKIGGGIFGVAFGTYCWQTVAFKDTYRQWRQQSYNKDVMKIFNDFLSQQETLKKYICPIKKVLCLCPIKIVKTVDESKSETFYYSGTDLADPKYVKQVIEHTKKKNLDAEDIRIDLVAFGTIYKQVNELLNKQKVTLSSDIDESKKKINLNEINDEDKEKIILTGLKNIRQSLINYGKNVSDHEIKEITKTAEKEGFTEREIQRRKNILKISYLQLDTLEKTDTLDVFCSVAKDMLSALAEDKKITDEEHEKRFLEIAQAELNFSKKKIEANEFKNILYKVLSSKEI